MSSLAEGKYYLFALDYGNRKEERKFVSDVLKNFDPGKLTGCALYINNNPYNLELYFSLNFSEDDEFFESWLSRNYPHKTRAYNLFIDDLFIGAANKSYNVTSYLEPEVLDIMMPSTPGGLFLIADREILNLEWGKTIMGKSRKVFLSHSSQDKKVVDEFFNELQKSNIKVWYDREEIVPGDSITSKINEGLHNSDIGIIFLSENFLSKKSGWTESECNYFIHQRMRMNKKFIVVNLGIDFSDIPPLLQDYRYIDYTNDNAIQETISAILVQIKNLDNN